MSPKRSWENLVQPEPEKLAMEPALVPGLNRITVGDLTANMIGSATLRIVHQGAIIEGPLTNLRIEAETTAVYVQGSETPRAVVHSVEIDVAIGSIVMESLSRDHHVAVL